MQINRTATSSSLLGTSYTLTTGSKRYLLFMANEIPATAPAINGETMTVLESVSDTFAAVAYGLVVPDSWSGALTVSGSNVRYEKYEFENVDPNNPVLDSGSHIDDSADISESLSVDCLQDGWVQDVIGVNTSPTKGANQTLDRTGSTLGTSHYTTPANGSITMSWSWSGNSDIAMVVVSLKNYRQPVSVIWF